MLGLQPRPAVGEPYALKFGIHADGDAAEKKGEDTSSQDEPPEEPAAEDGEQGGDESKDQGDARKMLSLARRLLLVQ